MSSGTTLSLANQDNIALPPGIIPEVYEGTYDSITCCNALTNIRNIPDGFIQLIIADIPYFGILNEEWDNQWHSLEEYPMWLDVLFSEFARVLNDGGACYVYSCITHYPYVQLCLNEHLDYAFTITWKKQRSRGNG